MGRNELEVFFDHLEQRHYAQAKQLALTGIEALELGDLDKSDMIDRGVSEEKGKMRFLRGFAKEVLTRLQAEGIKILEVEETPQVETPPVAAVVEPEEAVALPAVVPPALVVSEVVTPSTIPQVFIAPDGHEFGGKLGGILAFLADEEGGWIPKRRDATAKSVHGVTGREVEQKIGNLVRYYQPPSTRMLGHGIKIESHVVPPEVRVKGGKSFDWISFVPEAEAPVEVSPQLQAAVLADVMLTAYRQNPDRQQQLGINLGQADISKLENIRQSIEVLEPELKSRLLRECQSLVLRFLADVGGVYDELDKKPGSEDTLIALSYLTPLATDTEGAFNQLFTDII